MFFFHLGWGRVGRHVGDPHSSGISVSRQSVISLSVWQFVNLAARQYVSLLVSSQLECSLNLFSFSVDVSLNICLSDDQIYCQLLCLFVSNERERENKYIYTYISGSTASICVHLVRTDNWMDSWARVVSLELNPFSNFYIETEMSKRVATLAMELFLNKGKRKKSFLHRIPAV